MVHTRPVIWISVHSAPLTSPHRAAGEHEEFERQPELAPSDQRSAARGRRPPCSRHSASPFGNGSARREPQREQNTT